MLKTFKSTLTLIKPTLQQPKSLYYAPLQSFTMFDFFKGDPPKGFERFKRSSKSSRTPKKNTNKDIPEQSIEVNNEQETKGASESSEQSPQKEAQNEKSEDVEQANNEQKNESNDQDVKKSSKKDKETPKLFDYENWFGMKNPKKDKKGKKKNEEEDPDEPDPQTKLLYGALAGLTFVGLVSYDSIIKYYQDQENITYKEFQSEYLASQRVKEILVQIPKNQQKTKATAIVQTKEGLRKRLCVGNVDHFLENLERFQLERGASADRLIPVKFDKEPDSERFFDNLMTGFHFLGILFMMYFSRKVFKGGIFQQGGQQAEKSNIKIFGKNEKIDTKFKDVAGQDEAKLEIMEFVEFLKKPERFNNIGAKIPRGALLSGPPGTGKTLLAKAAAGEAGVPFIYTSGSDFDERFVGMGASRVRELFQTAKKNHPAIIFIDEIDAVGKKREGQGNEEKDNTLNQLLVEMDGFGTDKSVVVLAATNMRDSLDSALTRPGRFDRSIEVTLPDIGGRKEIFMVHLKPISVDPSKSLEEYAKRLATLTPGFSGADIANLCNEAAILAARKGQEYVYTEDFEAASERVLAGLEKKKMISEQERRTVAVHESGHAVASWFLEGGHPLLKLTIIPRSKGSLGFAQYLPNESSLETREELMDRICCILGGRCSEELFNGKVTTGAYDDLKKAYDIARKMVVNFGMSERIGFVGFTEGEYVKKHSEITAQIIDEEIKKIIDECTEKTRELVRKHKVEIENLSTALLDKETLDLQHIVNILGERPFPPKSNYKQYLEYKRKQEAEKQEKVNEQDSNVDGQQQQPQAQTA